MLRLFFLFAILFKRHCFLVWAQFNLHLANNSFPSHGRASIYSSVFYRRLSCTRGHGGLNPLPAIIGWRQDTPWTSHQIITEMAQRNKQVHPHSLPSGLGLCVPNESNLHFFELWEKLFRYRKNLLRPVPVWSQPGTFLLWGDSACHCTTHERSMHWKKKKKKHIFALTHSCWTLQDHCHWVSRGGLLGVTNLL